MKKNIRVGTLLHILSNSPNKIFSLKTFCDDFGAAKSSISEDLKEVKEITKKSGLGIIETIPGASGGVRYIPYYSDEQCKTTQLQLCELLDDSSRILGGGFLYTSDIMFNPSVVRNMAAVFARKFQDCGADYIATIEAKGIPIAIMTAELLNISVAVVRRETKISEGPTVSINYFSGAYDRIQKMSIAKKAANSGSCALIIDDFMRGGGSIKGITEILSEFDISVVGTGVAIASIEPEVKKVDNYTPLVYLAQIDENKNTINVIPNEKIFEE